MPIGLFSCCLGVFAGGLLGSCLRRWIGEDLREMLPRVFGLTAICNGILSVIKAAQMPVVTLAVIAGTLLGHLAHLEDWVVRGLRAGLQRVPTPEGFDLPQYVTIAAVFCASGFGLYAVMVESISGDRAQIFSKAMLDFFVAVLFGGSMGVAVSLIALPQLVIFVLFFFLARVLMPLMDAAMLANFIACGGLLTMAAGLRMSKIREYPLIDMLPSLAMVLILTPLLAGVFG